MTKEIKIAGHIAARYFFSRKSTHAVNIIAIVAVIGISVVTAAMVCILSIFNGFEDFITSQISSIAPTYRIVHRDQKSFALKECTDLALFQDVIGTSYTPAFETKAIINYDNNHTVAHLLGVDSSYFSTVPIHHLLIDGEASIGLPDLPMAVAGLGVVARLGAGIGQMEALEIVTPKREGRLSVTIPHKNFSKVQLPLTGIIQTDQPEHEDLVILPLHIVQELQQYPQDIVTSILIGQHLPPSDLKKLRSALPSHLLLQDKYEQYPDIYKVLKVEKWISFALLIFVLLLSLFSVVSTLGMLIIEKKEDAKTLNTLGARQSLLDKIILLEGWLLSVTGLTIGLVVGIGLTYLQQSLGFVKLGDGSSGAFAMSAYPVKLLWTDIFSIIIVIITIGWISSIIAHKIFYKKGSA